MLLYWNYETLKLAVNTTLIVVNVPRIEYPNMATKKKITSIKPKPNETSTEYYLDSSNSTTEPYTTKNTNSNLSKYW